MATQKGADRSAKKRATAKKSTGEKASRAATLGLPGTAGQLDLDRKIDLTEMTTASGQTVDQHPRPISPSLIFPPPLPPIPLDECGAGTFSCQRSSIATTGSNNDETDFPNRIGNYHKGLPHDLLGEVIPAAYQTLLDATVTPTPGEFPFIRTTIGANCGRKLTNPQAGLATDREGPITSNMKMRSAPKLNSREEAAEAVELYWMALLRDVPFTQFTNGNLVEIAAGELSSLTDFTGPKVGGKVTPESIFRGCSRGNEVGPLLSQFLLKDIPYGSLVINQRQQTVVGEAVAGAGNADYLTKYPEWLAIQNGKTNFPSDMFDSTPRYIRNMRDIGQYVHVDALYEAYLNACLILLSLGTPVDDGNPYKEPPTTRPNARNQIGFGTFGGPHILSLVCEVATRALKAVWYQKWFVHRRLRPEAYGGLIHHTKSATKLYPVDPQVLNSDAVARTFSKYGTYLLPMAFPEGSPTHPAYGAGHATVAGACVTILKAWFDENAPITNPVVASDDGLSLVPYTGGDAGRLTVGGELNKVAANIAIARNMAGVHWRSDYFDSIRLGERVAICVLSNQKNDYFELPNWSFTFTSFDNETIRVSPTGVTGKKPGFTPCTDRNVDVL
jgi:hypothetical protein